MAITTAEVNSLAYESKEKVSGIIGTLGRLHRWKNERPLLCAFFERKARKQICKAASSDLLHSPNLQPENIVTLMTKNSFAKLDRLLRVKDAENITLPKKDTVTHESYVIRFRRENENTLVAEEISQTGSVISQARVSSTGRADLTLNFTGERYMLRNANPQINVDVHFPRAASTVFNLLVGLAE